jgi:hypothetical protein
MKEEEEEEKRGAKRNVLSAFHFRAIDLTRVCNFLFF